MHHVPLAFQCNGERGENGDNLVSCMQKTWFCVVSQSKVMVLKGEEELECEVHVDGIRLEHVSEFKYLGCTLDESGTDEAECSMKVASGGRVASAIRSLVNARDLQLECARVLNESLLVPVLMYSSETMLWKEKEIQN